MLRFTHTIPSMGRRLRGLAVAAVWMTVTGLIASASYMGFLIFERQEALSGFSGYNISWSAGQAVSEMARLQTAIAEAAQPGLGGSSEAVALRYDIVLNRLMLLSGGEFFAFVSDRGNRVAALNAVRQAVAEVRPLLDSIDTEDNAARALALLEPLNSHLIGLAAEANRVGGETLARGQAELRHLHWHFTALIVGLTVCGFVLVWLLTWNHKLLRRAHDSLKATAEELRTTTISRATLDAALTNMSHGLCMVDADQRLMVFNQRFAEILGLPQTMIRAGMPFSKLNSAVAADAKLKRLVQPLLVRQQLLCLSGEPASLYEELADGRVLAVSHKPLSDGGWIATFEDVTERRRAEARIAHMARHDALTGLPNRVLFRERLEAGLRGLASHGGVAVLCLDLDNFKPVNDTLGHPVGDELLRAVTKRLSACVRETDTVARLGGDEFAIVQVSVDQPEAAIDLAKRIIAALAEPFQVRGHQVVIGTSVGISLASRTWLDPDTLLQQADLALYGAKNSGRGEFKLFEAAMEAKVQARRTLEVDLRQALAADEFEVFYQPLVITRNRRVSGFEALARWYHPTRGIVDPGEFIPIAEEIGLIAPIGALVLQKACQDAARWPDDLKLAVNLSPVQFRIGDLVAVVKDALRQSGLPARRLQLEITETVLLHDTDLVLTTLHKLRDLGVQISMDDFGTGYSSLSYLRKFPFDKIKIDRSFVGELGRCGESGAIVTMIMQLAVSLGMETTVEGVETMEQLVWLEENGCMEVQGYLFGKPAPLSQTEAAIYGASHASRSLAALSPAA